MSIFKRFIPRTDSKKSKRNSVGDFAETAELTDAMMERPPSPKSSYQPFDSSEEITLSCQKRSQEEKEAELNEDAFFYDVEWRVDTLDMATSEPQTMEEEIKRLQVLQSYFVLDTEREAEFDRLTSLGRNIFGTPICLISLVDLGRQWFLSKAGLEATETPRKQSFCTHCVASKMGQLIVPDATKDPRFQNNPLVTGGIKVRFYAGMALVSPEGYKLGSFCVVSPVARPEGLHWKEKEMLHQLSQTAVGLMVNRRDRIKQINEIATTLVETSEKLDAATSTLEGVLNRQGNNLEEKEARKLKKTAKKLTAHSRVCAANARKALSPDDFGSGNQDRDSSSTDGDGTSISDDDFQERLMTPQSLINVDQKQNLTCPQTDLQRLYNNLNTIVAKLPKKVHVAIKLSKGVHKVIQAEGILVCRSILSMVAHCTKAATHGTTHLCIQTIKRREQYHLLVQCSQGGDTVPLKEAKQTFCSTNSCLLANVASNVSAMGGRFGVKQSSREDDQSLQSSDVLTSSSQKREHTIYWFRIPYETTCKNDKLSKDLVKVHAADGPGTDNDSEDLRAYLRSKTRDSDDLLEALLLASDSDEKDSFSQDKKKP